eukprot:sb/3476864/
MYYSRTPIYRAPIYRNPDLPGDKLPPMKKINGISPRYTGHPDLPGKMLSPEDTGKSGSDCNCWHSRGGCGAVIPQQASLTTTSSVQWEDGGETKVHFTNRFVRNTKYKSKRID